MQSEALEAYGALFEAEAGIDARCGIQYRLHVWRRLLRNQACDGHGNDDAQARAVWLLRAPPTACDDLAWVELGVPKAGSKGTSIDQREVSGDNTRARLPLIIIWVAMIFTPVRMAIATILVQPVVSFALRRMRSAMEGPSKICVALMPPLINPLGCACLYIPSNERARCKYPIQRPLAWLLPMSVACLRGSHTRRLRALHA